MTDEQTIRVDRMRFTKNKFSANLALVAIAFDVLYFLNIYASDLTVKTGVGNYYYQTRIGISIIYNLLFMLAAFLCSEGAKNYKNGYNYGLFVIGALQIVRIFILPANAAATMYTTKAGTNPVMGPGQHTLVVAYLVLSAVCCFVAAIVGIKRCTALSAHMKDLENS